MACGWGEVPGQQLVDAVDGMIRDALQDMAQITFSSGKNGSISQSLTLNPPGAGSFSCPSGQSLVLASVSYTNVEITDTTNNIDDIPGTYSRNFTL